MTSIRLFAGLALLAGGCTSTPDYVGVYQITAHHWIAEIMAAGQLACTDPGYVVDDGDPYFALVNDADHPNTVQYVRCSEPSGCTTQPDYAWVSLSGDGANPSAFVEHSEFDARCALGLGTFDVTYPSDNTLHLDMLARRAYDDQIDDCTVERARALASMPNCIYVDRLDGERVE